MDRRKKAPSELRYDIVSKDWVIIATGRAKRPENFKKERRNKTSVSCKKCPFCNLNKFCEKPVLIYFKGNKICLNGSEVKDWTTVVIPNKYPVFLPGLKYKKIVEGDLYRTIITSGYHELVITSDHEKPLALLPIEHVKEVIDVYQKRYSDLKKEDYVNHIAIFHNHGPEAGASQPHPHSQILTTPLIDVDLRRSITNSRSYYRKNNKCLYCKMNEWEIKEKKRLVFENKDFVAVCPFASKVAFQVIITPKKHLPYFEKITEEEKINLAEAFKTVLYKLYKGLGDPSFNFYLHTSPCDGKTYPFYHWHWSVLPKTSIMAGFEIGTKIEISTIEPEEAAKFLRKQ